MPRAKQTETEDLAEDRLDGAVRGFVGYNLKRAYMVLHPAAQAALAEFELRIPSFTCLSVIVRNPGIAPSELADQLKLERSNIVVIIDELETRDLISRARMKTDRRRYALTATVRGRRVHDKAAEAIRRTEEYLLRGLDPEEQAQLVALLAKIEAATTD